ncbi:MAG: metalloregulator ArsR/SmtB family transcription factor [Desulfobacterales bacterium]
MKPFIKVMKALSDENRVLIIKLLQRKTMCVCEIQAALGLAQSTVSKHLKILADAGMVTHSKDGLWVNYRLADGTQSAYAASLLGNLRHWLEEELRVANALALLPGINRDAICGIDSKEITGGDQPRAPDSRQKQANHISINREL